MPTCFHYSDEPCYCNDEDLYHEALQEEDSEEDTGGVPAHVEPETAEKVLARLERQNEATARMMSGLCVPRRIDPAQAEVPRALRVKLWGNA